MNFEDVKTLSISAGEVMESMGKFMRDLGEVAEHDDLDDCEVRVLESMANQVGKMRGDMLTIHCALLVVSPELRQMCYEDFCKDLDEEMARAQMEVE